MSQRIFLWESLSEDEKNKVYVGTENSYFLKKTPNQTNNKMLPPPGVCCVDVVKISVDLLFIDLCKKIIELF
jgi:hypothetical protein